MSFKRLWAILLAASLSVGAASAQYVSDVYTEVTLRKDGSAHVSQTWKADVISGTEWYIPISNLGEMTITDFSVSENGFQFVNEGNSWNTQRSLEQKAGRCGIVEKGSSGLELCWGQGNYGNHTYKISYVINGLVQSLQDYDAFNHRFVNPGMDGPPRHASIKFINATGTEWTLENTRFWGFGFNGDIHLVDGAIVAESSEPFSDRSNMTVMVSFDKDIFAPVISRDIPFEKMKSKAFKGSSYESSDDAFELAVIIVIALVILFGLFVLIYIAVALATGHKYKKSLFGKTKIEDWYRDLPLDGNLPAVWYVYSKSKRFSNDADPKNLIGAYFLKWILMGVVKLRREEGRRKKVSLVFTGEIPESEGDTVSRVLFDMALAAAGDEVLESAEFRRWSRQNYEQMIAWPKLVSTSGSSWLFSNGYLKGLNKAMPEKYQDMVNVIGFKNFLNDFTLSEERGAQDVGLWKNYLVYASMFGIADKVAKQFKSLYPDFFDELAQDSGMQMADLLYVITYTNRMTAAGYSTALAKQAEVTAEAIQGSGGSTSFGGGGGFSGGGFGGGSR